MTVTQPERISLEKLRGLVSAAPPCVSIVLIKREARNARIAFKHALAQVRAKLAASESKHDIASLLGPLELAATNVIDSSKEPATFIFLRSPDVCESFRTRYLIGHGRWCSTHSHVSCGCPQDWGVRGRGGRTVANERLCLGTPKPEAVEQACAASLNDSCLSRLSRRTMDAPSFSRRIAKTTPFAPKFEVCLGMQLFGSGPGWINGQCNMLAEGRFQALDRAILIPASGAPTHADGPDHLTVHDDRNTA